MADTIAQILAEVGTDPILAGQHLAAEQKEPKPRKTLVARLEQIIASSAADGPDLARSLAMWTEITTKYDLRPDEMRILEDACLEMDLIDRMNEALRSERLIVTGSQGQDVSNPLVSEIRQHRATLKSLLASLKLPDEPGAGRQSRSVQAREAARARWGHGS